MPDELPTTREVPVEFAPAVPEPAPFRIQMRVVEGPHAGQQFSFAQHDHFIVGRSSHAHFRLAGLDKHISRYHFMIEVNPPQCLLLDLGSRNGTFVNEQKVRVSAIRNGDRIRAGHTVLDVAIEAVGDDSGSIPDLPAAPPPPAAKIAAAAPPKVLHLERCLACGQAIQRDWFCPTCQAIAKEMPQPVGNYRVLRQLGKGAMGTVYLACRLNEPRPEQALVALKVIQPAVTGSKKQRDLFLREVQILKELQHPHIIGFRDAGEQEHCFFFAMEYLPGMDLMTWVQQHGPMPVPLAARLGSQLLQALAYAHAKGFVHRDIKPANVLKHATAEPAIVKLADFGLARVYHASQLSGLTMAGDMAGSPAFMPPEQILHPRTVKPPADLYAVAATLYYVLTKKMLYDGVKSVNELFGKVLDEKAHPVPLRERRADVPESMAQLIEHNLAKPPEARSPSAAEFRQALLPYL